MRCYYMKRVTVEPVAFLALFSLSLLNQVSQQYVFEKLKPKAETRPPKRTNLTDLLSTCNTSTTSTTLYFLDENVLRSEAGQWLLYLKLAAIIPGVFTSLILGIWSDKTGRKIVLLVASCGGLIQVSLHLLVINLDLSIHVLLSGNIAYGISGYAVVIIAICMAYTADITSKQERTIQIVILSTLIGFGKGLAEFVSGYWEEAHGLVPPLWLVFGFNVINIIYIIFFLPETIIREYRSRPLGNCKLYVINICRLFSNGICRTTWCRLVTIYLVSFFVIAVVQLGCHEAMLTYSINWPVCFGKEYVRYFSGAMTCIFVTSLVAVKLFQFVPWLSHHWILEIGLLSAIGALVLTAFAKTTALMFIVPVAGILAQVPLAVLRACLSKIVDFHHQGLLFAVIGCIEIIGWLTGYLVFGSLYHATKHIMRGMTFLIGAGVLAISTILLGVTQFYQGYRSYNVFVESITTRDDVSTSDSEDSETVAILGENQARRNHGYQSCG
ncbi:proton-coupled folate transporter-like [Actinia tenebrosa]|uniref:Proton-coupled folate transporter n=1 Tax=Actinia tenebrosa TaxID=6105 RepID=A0A6P8HHU6_ACTTE|nr:proton-coupled folate transporter-like [Actinia tenebrosa]XP_031552188.1 proton-coupled folate transporter-like [Actinia tenebrosa]